MCCEGVVSVTICMEVACDYVMQPFACADIMRVAVHFIDLLSSCMESQAGKTDDLSMSA